MLMLAGCSRVSEPEPSKYLIRHVFYSKSQTSLWTNATIEIIANGKIINTSPEEFPAYPKLKISFGRGHAEAGITDVTVDGSMGYLDREDVTTSVEKDRWQLLSTVRNTIRPNEELRLKVYTKLFIPDSAFLQLTIVLDGKETSGGTLYKLQGKK